MKKIEEMTEEERENASIKSGEIAIGLSLVTHLVIIFGAILGGDTDSMFINFWGYFCLGGLPIIIAACSLSYQSLQYNRNIISKIAVILSYSPMLDICILVILNYISNIFKF